MGDRTPPGYNIAEASVKEVEEVPAIGAANAAVVSVAAGSTFLDAGIGGTMSAAALRSRASPMLPDLSLPDSLR